MEERTMGGISQFLSCRLGSTSFKFLGVPVGANPRLLSTWQPIIDSIKARLNSWRSRQLSIGGRVTLINSVLASLPLYLFSFYKAPRKVIEEIAKLQRSFLWGGDGETKKMAWVKWDIICTPKDKGGLGIKNLEAFNIALLTKWRWRILAEEGNKLWKEILVTRYGLKDKWPNENEYRRGWNKSSIWWRDMCQLGKGTNLGDGWFDDIVKIKMGRGNLIRFWKDKWLGRDTFAELFPTMYSLCNNKEAVVQDMGVWEGGVWRWKWEWVADLLPNEEQNFLYLQELLYPIAPAEGVNDYWSWVLDSARGFTVKCCYSWLVEFFAGGGNDAAEVPQAVWKNLWKNDVPSKVLIFAWRVLRGRIATREALFRRGVLTVEADKCCVFCLEEDESVIHLFLHCRVTKLIWQQVLSWLDVSPIDGEDMHTHFMEFGRMVKGKKQKRVKQLIWMAVIWNVWSTRNKIIFKGETISIPLLISSIKDCAWSWFKARQGRACRVGWADWFNCPLGCLSSL